MNFFYGRPLDSLVARLIVNWRVTAYASARKLDELLVAVLPWLCVTPEAGPVPGHGAEMSCELADLFSGRQKDAGSVGVERP